MNFARPAWINGGFTEDEFREWWAAGACYDDADYARSKGITVQDFRSMTYAERRQFHNEVCSYARKRNRERWDASRA